jgi:hypothetical protein
MIASEIKTPDRIECGCCAFQWIMAGFILTKVPPNGVGLVATQCTVCGQTYLSILPSNMESTTWDIRRGTIPKKSTEAELIKSLEECVQRAEKDGIPQTKIVINKFTIGKRETNIIKEFLKEYS